MKVKCNTKRQSRWVYLWQSNDELRKQVKGLLAKKIEGNGKAEEAQISMVDVDQWCDVQSCTSGQQVPAQIVQQHGRDKISDFTSKYKIVQIGGDGNCLFRCFSYHIYGD